MQTDSRDKKMNGNSFVRQATVAERTNNKIISIYTLSVSLVLVFASVVAAVVTGEGFKEVLDGFLRILLSPARNMPDYFELGGLAAACFNAGICGLACSILIAVNPTPARSVMLSGFFLVIAHGFYGLNFLNMWPCFLGVVIYCLVRKQSLGENLGIAMFATALAPFISEFFFAFPIGSRVLVFGVEFSIVGVVVGCLASVMFGFIVPALLPGTTKMHRGFNLYKAGLAIGLFGIFIFALMFKTLGLDPSGEVEYQNEIYESFGRSYPVFVNVVWGGIFLLTAVAGIILCKGNFTGYRALLKKDGHLDDFCEQFGMKTCLINIGIYGLFILLYFNLAIFCTDGVGFTGNVAGLIFAAVTFSASGQHPKNVYPILIGYTLLSATVHVICLVSGLDIPWTLSTQSYFGGAAFATGLCPIASKFGVKFGIIAGALSAVICTSTAQMHGGLMLYNGGFTAGLTAMLMVPILDFYSAEEKAAD